jgi:hypothetical protein
LYEYPLPGFSLKFVSGPEKTKTIKAGSWLIRWELTQGKRIFGFGEKKTILFPTGEMALAAKTELQKEADVITEVVE